MERKILTCIGCPMGCELTVEMENGKAVSVAGYTCKRGKIYAEKEVTHPTRIVTTTVRVSGGVLPVVPVKTREDIPKDKMFECVRELGKLTVEAPVTIGQTILADAAGTGIAVIATRTVEKK